VTRNTIIRGKALPNLIIFAGNSNPELARRIAHELRLDLGNATVGRFSDGEVNVEIRDNVRGSDVFLLQSTSSPPNDNLMEILVMSDAIRRASASRITAVMPYSATRGRTAGRARRACRSARRSWPTCSPSPVWTAF
jgi:phosphoribosylpyrophosphate synthetase